MAAPRASKSVSGSLTEASGPKKFNRSAGVGAIFRLRRLELGLEEKTVALYLTNVSVERIQNYETGKCEIPLSDVYALSNCLNVSPRIITQLLSKPLKPKK